MTSPACTDILSQSKTVDGPQGILKVVSCPLKHVYVCTQTYAQISDPEYGG